MSQINFGSLIYFLKLPNRVENCFGALKQDKIFKTALPYQYMRPLGVEIVKGVSIEPEFSDLSRFQVIFGACSAFLSWRHPGFKKNYTNNNQLTEIMRLVPRKLNIPQPMFNIQDLGFVNNFLRFPNVRTQGWNHFPLSNLEQVRPTLPIPIPVLPQDQLHQLFYWSMGPYRHYQYQQ